MTLYSLELIDTVKSKILADYLEENGNIATAEALRAGCYQLPDTYAHLLQQKLGSFSGGRAGGQGDGSGDGYGGGDIFGMIRLSVLEIYGLGSGNSMGSGTGEGDGRGNGQSE